MINEPNSFEVVNEDSLNDFDCVDLGDAETRTEAIFLAIIGRITNLSGI